MLIFCSLISLIVIVGHLVAVFKARLYWPFSYYPMYSLPLNKLIYPIIDGGKLTVISLIDISDPANPVDIFSSSGTFPPPFRPLDKLESAYLLAEATTMLKERNAMGMGRLEDATKKFAYADSGDDSAQLKKVVGRLFNIARGNGFQIRAMRLVKYEWDDYRARHSHFSRPDRVTSLGEFHD